MQGGSRQRVWVEKSVWGLVSCGVDSVGYESPAGPRYVRIKFPKLQGRRYLGPCKTVSVYCVLSAMGLGTVRKVF